MTSMALQRRHPLIKRGLNVLLTHPFQLAVAGMFVIAGIHMAQLLLSGVGFGLLTLPTPLVVCWIVMIVLGGALMLLGARGSVVSPLSRGAEKAGCILGGTAFATLGLAVAILLFSAWATWSQCFLVGAACFARFVAVGRVDRGLQRVAKEG